MQFGALWPAEAPKFPAADLPIELPRDFLCTNKQNKYLASESCFQPFIFSMLQLANNLDKKKKKTRKEISYEEIEMRVSSVTLEFFETSSTEK